MAGAHLDSVIEGPVINDNTEGGGDLGRHHLGARDRTGAGRRDAELDGPRLLALVRPDEPPPADAFHSRCGDGRRV
jgi:hypothetical protein